MTRLRFAMLLALLPAVAGADIPLQESQYAKDREKAIRQFNPELRDHCLKDFSEKWKKVFTPLGAASYSDAISRQVYKTVFWNHSDRGVAFTLPVAAEDDKGKFIGDVACFYAVDEGKLRFQLSQRVYRRF